MTLAAGSFPRRDGAKTLRWGGSLALVLLLHGVAALFLLSREMAADIGGKPPEAAVMIDLAPLPAPPSPEPSPPEPVPPQPVVEPQIQPVEPTPPQPPQPEIEMPALEPSPAPKPVVALPQKPPKAKPKQVEHPPQTVTERPPPPAAAPPVSAALPAPATAQPAVNAGASRASWQAQLSAWLQRYKRYPRLAQEQHQEGVVYLRFAMDRQGRVLSARIDKGSGFALLDEEVSALIERAQPLPAPPPEVPGERIELTLPVQFSLRGMTR
jgi:protein TonB